MSTALCIGADLAPEGSLIHGDETWVKVLKEDGRDAQTKSYMWAYRSGQDSTQPVVLFDYQPGRGQEHPQAFLASWGGLLMSDGYDAWRRICAGANLVQLYSAMVYKGPGLARTIADDIATQLGATRFATLAEAVGSSA